jgi:hypothetical protein
MCYSATASFAAGAVLVPLGAFTVACAWRGDRRYLTLASFPALFGVQQLLEGLVWRELDAGGGPGVAAPALGFLAFAYLLWLFLTPYAAAQIEVDPARRRAFLITSLIGAAFGLSLYLPLLLDPAWLAVRVERHSIVYDSRLIYDVGVPHQALRLFYAAIICLPLLASSAQPVRVFGLLIAASMALSLGFAAYAFTSVWCLFAAVLSAWIAVIVRPLPRPA